MNESLQEFLKEEHLTGDDQYYCDHCNCKQDAVRKICLTTLPPVLNIQLMRFVYDRYVFLSILYCIKHYYDIQFIIFLDKQCRKKN